MSYKLTRKDKGFTIIEVMIVLAIAALILLAVFLAIPNLQRASRNSGRKADAGRIGTAATNFSGNNNGSLPGSAADANTIITDAGALSQFSLNGNGNYVATCAVGTGSGNVNKLTVCVPPAAGVTLDQAFASNPSDSMVLATSAQCGASAGAMTKGTARQMALFYTQETSSASTWACLNL